MIIPCDKAFPLVPCSRSSVKVRVGYQGHNFKNNGRCEGVGVSQTHLVLASFAFLVSWHISTIIALQVADGQEVTVTSNSATSSSNANLA